MQPFRFARAQTVVVGAVTAATILLLLLLLRGGQCPRRLAKSLTERTTRLRFHNRIVCTDDGMHLPSHERVGIEKRLGIVDDSIRRRRQTKIVEGGVADLAQTIAIVAVSSCVTIDAVEAGRATRASRRHTPALMRFHVGGTFANAAKRSANGVPCAGLRS